MRIKFGSHLEKSLFARFPRRVFKEKRARGPLSPCDPGQGRNTLQPVAAVGGVFDDGVRLHERNQDAVAARLEEARREEHRIRLGSYGDHAACDEERHRHQEQVKRRAGKRRRGTRRRRQRLTRGATGVSALSNSHNIAKLLTRIILRIVLLPWNEVKPASGIVARELPSSEKLRQSKMTGVL